MKLRDRLRSVDLNGSPCGPLNEILVKTARRSESFPVFTDDRLRPNIRSWHYNPSAPVQAIAFYDHAGKFGVQQSFAPGAFPRFQAYWSPGRRMLAVNMLAPVTPMEPGQKLTFNYEIGYLAEPPAPVSR